VHFGNHSEKSMFAVTSLGQVPLIVGHTWLVHHNPEIDWSTGKIAMTRCPDDCGLQHVHEVLAIKHSEGSINPSTSVLPHNPSLPSHHHGYPSSSLPSQSLWEKRDKSENLQGNGPSQLSYGDHGSNRNSILHHSSSSPCSHPAMPSSLSLIVVPGHLPGILSRRTGKSPPDENEENVHEEDHMLVAFLFPKESVSATESISIHLAIEQHKKTFKCPFEEMVPKQYHDFQDVFSKESFDHLPPCHPWDHAIKLKEDVKPTGTKLYPLSPNEQKEMDAFLKEHLKTGWIHPSKSPIAAPVFFVKKKDGGLCFVQDYRKFNTATVKNAYPLPLVTDILNQVTWAKFFTKLDVWWGYNNIWMWEGDEWKAAFCTNWGLFEPLVMFFGLCNSLATFQTMMNHLFWDLVAEGVIAVYMDDILVFTETLSQHYEVVHRVLKILWENNLFLKAEKCTFGVTTVE
jgi:Reverse transcriptase (RNA-dependent DNA polymerase)